MSLDHRVHTNRLRAESFGADADAYERYRPSYPDALIRDLVATEPADALDIGCGTGKAARLLAARGVRVLGVEIDGRMAGIARRHGIEVETAAFEQWDARARRFDLVVSGQAWHWVDPVAGIAKLVTVLRPGGLSAPFWNFSELEPHARRAIDAAYRAVAPDLLQSVTRGTGPATLPDRQRELQASGAFGSVAYRYYDWRQTCTREQYLALLRTHSDHSTRPPEELDALLAAVGAAIDRLGGTLRLGYRTHVLLARLP